MIDNYARRMTTRNIAEKIAQATRPIWEAATADLPTGKEEPRRGRVYWYVIMFLLFANQFVFRMDQFPSPIAF